MDKRIILLFVLLLSLMPFFIVNNNPGKSKLCAGAECFDIEIADSAAEREIGLMSREELCERCGMLFIFESSGNHSFWMKNTEIYLDIIWIDSDYKVVHIIKSASPCQEEPCDIYRSSKESLYVLELNSGASEKYGINIGGNIEIKGLL